MLFVVNKEDSMIKQYFAGKFLLLYFFIACSLSISAQKPDSVLNEYATKFPQEKIYIHYDKPYYNAGETIWFKAYLSADNSASSLSKTVYAELINEKGTILQKKIMPVIESGAASFFDLPDSVQSPILYVRAYTAWMLNFDSSLLYLKPVSIISNAAKKTTAVTPVYTLTFFPEGGDLVTDIESLVAFKATDQKGMPVYVTGNIVDSKGNKITSFEPAHDGMGTFAFTPAPGEQYKAVWKDKKGISHETALPTAKNQGAVLSVLRTNKTVTYTLKRSKNATVDFTSFYIVAQMRQQLMYSAKINLASRDEVTASFPTDSLGTGIVQLTVFNANQQPVAERIFFVNNNDYYFNTDLHAVELNLGKRKHNTLQIDVGGRIVTNLSVSVTDESTASPLNDRDNIYSGLLLTSDLKGYVYNPSYYFSSEEDSIAQQLDLVMLTNGWRRFKWEDLQQNKLPKIIYQPENYISLSGNVYGPTPNLLKGQEITAILKTKSSNEFYNMPVSTDGKFSLDGIAFFDTASLYYQFNRDKDKQLTSTSSFSFKVNFANPPAPGNALLRSLYPPAFPDTSTLFKNKLISRILKDEFEEGKKIKSLQAVVVKSKLKSKEQILDEKFTSGFFSRGDSYIFPVEDDPLARSAQTVLSYLQSKVAGLQITMTSPPKVSWRMSVPTFYLNESAAQIDQIQSISMGDVAMIKVFRPPFMSSSLSTGGGGAIAVYLKKGGETTVTNGLDFARLNGYSTVKEFYSPDYESMGDNAPQNDVRSTLYWNPNIILDNDTRRMKVSFFNNDKCKKIRVIIEGLNREGKFSREEKVFE
ncbi:MAG: hypothetical protein JST81_04635 [Bacteroidetes bacterium]|nr:hypothetical protein [Bacteroidota bacterium]